MELKWNVPNVSKKRKLLEMRKKTASYFSFDDTSSSDHEDEKGMMRQLGMPSSSSPSSSFPHVPPPCSASIATSSGAAASEQNDDGDKRVEADDAPGPAATDLCKLSRFTRLLQQQGCELAEAGNYGAALCKWETALAHTPDNAVLHQLKAQVLLEIERIWPAVQAATRATELQPSWAEAHVVLARAQRNFGEPELALASFSRAVKLGACDTEARAELDEIRKLVVRRRQMAQTNAGPAGICLEAAGICSTQSQKTFLLNRAVVGAPMEREETCKGVGDFQKILPASTDTQSVSTPVSTTQETFSFPPSDACGQMETNITTNNAASAQVDRAENCLVTAAYEDGVCRGEGNGDIGKLFKAQQVVTGEKDHMGEQQTEKKTSESKDVEASPIHEQQQQQQVVCVDGEGCRVFGRET